MLAELEASAFAAGARRVVLNTGAAQPEAIALYESSGYLPTAGFGYYARTPGAMFYGKTLLTDGDAAKRPASRDARTGHEDAERLRRS